MPSCSGRSSAAARWANGPWSLPGVMALSARWLQRIRNTMWWPRALPMVWWWRRRSARIGFCRWRHRGEARYPRFPGARTAQTWPLAPSPVLPPLSIFPSVKHFGRRALKPVRNAAGIGLAQIAIPRHGKQREILPVAVITQIENAQKTNGVVGLFLPFPRFALAARKPGNAARDSRVIDLAGGHQPQDGPSRVRGRALLVTAGWGSGIGFFIFAPAAVFALDFKQKSDGAPHRGILRRNADRVERAKHRPSSVNVIRAPAAEPTSVFFLLAP